MTTQIFFQEVAPVALAISATIQQSGKGRLFPEVLMSQFANETGWHAEGVWQGNPGWKGRYNLAGISPNGQIADYTNYTEFEQAYVSVITQSAYGFPAVLSSQNINTQFVALGRSDWALPYHYDLQGKGSRPGIDLLQIYNDYKAQISAALDAARSSEKPVPQPQPAQEPAPQKVAAKPEPNPQPVPAPVETKPALKLLAHVDGGMYAGALALRQFLAGDIVLDTGSAETVLTKPIADSLNLPNLGPATIRGIAGSSPAYYTEYDLTVGDKTYTKQPAIVDPSLNFQFSGLFGLKFFADNNLVVQVDPKSGIDIYERV